MTLFWHELRQGRSALLLWAFSVAGLLGVCVLIYPEIASQMENVGDMFAAMGSFSAAFGMDRIHFGSFPGFFAVECGNILGLGGAFFAGMLGVNALSKEEGGHTAEFLLSHPLSRGRIVAQKLGAVLAQVTLFHAVSLVVTLLCVAVIDEQPPARPMALLFLSHFLMEVEIAALTFGLSAFLKQKSAGAGLGLAALFYFANLIANLTDKAAFLKFLTPFAYTEGADILTREALDGRYVAVGMALGVLAVGLAFGKYRHKDIA